MSVLLLTRLVLNSQHLASTIFDFYFKSGRAKTRPKLIKSYSSTTRENKFSFRSSFDWKVAVPDPDLEIRRGGASVWATNKGGLPGPLPWIRHWGGCDLSHPPPPILLHFHNIQVMATFGRRLWYSVKYSLNSIKLSPEREMNSIYLALLTDPEGDSCFSIYQISYIKMKKELFVNKRRHLVRVCLRCNW